MRICIYGAGAIGGYLGVQLALAGEEVSLIARGPHLEAMRTSGVKLRIAGEERVAHPTCTAIRPQSVPRTMLSSRLRRHRSLVLSTPYNLCSAPIQRW